jgi:superoxide dismutase, Fe-Mn family
MKKATTILIALLSVVSFSSLDCEKLLQELKKEEQKIFENKRLPLPKYSAQKFDLVGKLKGLSKKQIEEHEELYQGYVNKRNEITEQLEAADRSKANNVTFSPFRGLKLSETFAMNGDILHRLYFQNMGSSGKTIGPKTKELLIKNFGSVEEFKNDLFATAKSARGWAITAFTPDDGRVHNFLLDTHNQMVPALMIPLLVLDVYEHAYMIDFGIKRVPYLDVFWENIDWDVIEHRVAFVEKHASMWNDYFTMK